MGGEYDISPEQGPIGMLDPAKQFSLVDGAACLIEEDEGLVSHRHIGVYGSRQQSGHMTAFPLSWLQIMKNQTVSATEFKAKCLAYLDEIE